MKMIGTSLARLDALEKVTGRAHYAADIRADDLLVALAVRAPTAPGRILAIDTTQAVAVPGVVAIFTHQDAEQLGWSGAGGHERLGAEWLGRPALNDRPEDAPVYRPLLGDQILFAGQWIAVVVAKNLEAARNAIRRVVAVIETQAVKPSASISPGLFFAGDMQHEREDKFSYGTVHTGHRATYSTPMQLHQPMEPSATTAIWDGNRVTLHDSTQGVQAAAGYVAASLGIPIESVQVVSPYVGGGFGAKNQIWPHQALAAHLARAVGHPVRLQLTRQDMAVASGYRSETSQEITLAADEDGHLKLLRHYSAMPTSLRGGFFEPCGLNSLMLYRSERVEVAHEVVRRHIATPTPMRAPGETPGSFALETALDELAHAMDLDPLVLRVRNLAPRDDYHRREWSSNNLLECYQLGAERFGWAERSAVPRTRQRHGRLVGCGMANTAYPAQAVAASVRLTIGRDTGLLLETSVSDIGTGMRTLLAQAVAEGMQVDPNMIQIRLGDSALPASLTVGRSRGTASVVPAAIEACLALRRELDLLDPPVPNASNITDPFQRLGRTGREKVTVTAPIRWGTR